MRVYHVQWQDDGAAPQNTRITAPDLPAAVMAAVYEGVDPAVLTRVVYEHEAAKPEPSWLVKAGGEHFMLPAKDAPDAVKQVVEKYPNVTTKDVTGISRVDA